MVIRFLLEKEFRQMMRNAVLPRVFIALPLALLAIIPLVATQEVKNLKVGVVDADRSPLSERLVQKLAASDFFVLTGVFASYDDALRDLEQGGGDLILEIGPDFERGLANGEESAVRLELLFNAVLMNREAIEGAFATRREAAPAERDYTAYMPKGESEKASVEL